MPTVDNLDIQISASVNKANASLDLLVKRLSKVSASLAGVNSRGLATMASGVNKLANAMNNFGANTNTAVFSRLTRNLNSLANINPSAISNASGAINSLASSMRVLNNANVSDSAMKLGELAKGIAQLGYKSSTQAIQNIPLLANAMRNLMQTLSTAPRVNQNLIDMTNALARLARTGASSGAAANSLSRSLNLFSRSSQTARISSLSLASAIGKLYANFWLLFRVAGLIGKAINISSDLTEVQNVVNTTFGDMTYKIEEFAETSIEKFGMSELSAKKFASTFQAMGSAMNIDTSSIESANEYLNKQTNGYVGLSNSMSDVSLNLTKLTADMASFYNVSQEDVADDLTAIFTGQTRPLRQYGIDLTQATLKEWAMKRGLDSNIESMTQAEKTMLRYQYVLEQSGAAHGDFEKTAGTWANQVRILKQNFEELASVIGKSFINALRPLVVALNNAMTVVINFAKVVSDSLGKIFGWQYEETTGGGIASEYEDAADGAEDLADGTGKAADNAKKLKQQLQGIDELNVLSSDTGNDNGAGSGSGADLATSGASGDGGWKPTESIFKNYESDLDTLFKLGKHIGDTLTDALKGIDWNNVYQSAKNFGSGLASFLNGLISPDLFGSLGTTIAGALNTALYALNSFGKTFDWKDFGKSIASGINNFFDTFDFGELADTLNTWVDGIGEAIKGFVDELDVKDIFSGITEFATNLELDTIVVTIGAISWMYGGQVLVAGALKSLLAKQVATGIGTSTIPVSTTLGLSVAVAIIGFKIGNMLYEKVPAVQEIADAIVEWIFADGEEIAVARTISIALGGLTFSLGTAGIISTIKTAITTAITTASAEASLAGTGVGAVILGKISAAISGAGSALSTLGSTIVSALGTAFTTVTGALSGFATTISTAFTTTIIPAFTNFFTVTLPGALSSVGSSIVGFFTTFGSTIVTVLGSVAAVIASAIAGWNIGQWLYEAISGEDIDMSFTEQIKEIASAFTDGTIVNAVKMMWSDIKKWFKDGWDKAKKAVSDIASWFNSKIIKPVVRFFKGLWKDVSAFFSNLWKDIQKVWSAVSGWFDKNIIQPIIKYFGNLKTNISTALTTAWTLIKTTWSAVSGWFSKNILTPVSTTFDSLKAKIKTALNDAWTLVKGIWKGASDWFSGILSNVKDLFTGKKGIKETIKDAFKTSYEFIKTTFNQIGTFFKGIANDVIEPIGKAINGIIKGLNWILGKVGSKTTIASWSVPQFAKGSSGLPEDTIGIVNDQKGSTYRELIVPPNGKPFIPEGRNVMLPMAKGTKIMPADQTKKFMAGIPRFEGGIGDVFGDIANSVKSFTGDVLDYIAEPSKIVKVAMGKFVDTSGIGGAVLNIAKGTVNTVFDSSVDFIKKIFDATSSAKVESATKWAVGIANNNAHGYDQNSRWGTPDYDCSSLVISAFEQAGIKLKSSGATYTGNMLSAALKNGFKEIKGSVNTTSGTGLKRGDILLNKQHHTAIYLGNGQIVQASSNEFGGAKGGRKGDQTGKEIYVRGYYNYPWDSILRYAKGFKDGVGRITMRDFRVPTFATGGFPEDGWFRANRGEIMGKFDNGQSVVANNMQITQGISDAVQKGNQQMISYLQQEITELRQQNEYLREIADKEFGISEKQIGKASQKYARDYMNRTGKPAYI